MYGKREEYFLLEWIQWCQDIEYLENVFDIDACLLLLRMRKDVYHGSSQKGKIPKEVNFSPKRTIKVFLVWSRMVILTIFSSNFCWAVNLTRFTSLVSFSAKILLFSPCCSPLLFQQSAIGRAFPIFVACKQPFTYIDPVIKCENVQKTVFEVVVNKMCEELA